jgi:hypothetical protein
MTTTLITHFDASLDSLVFDGLDADKASLNRKNFRKRIVVIITPVDYFLKQDRHRH